MFGTNFWVEKSGNRSVDPLLSSTAYPYLLREKLNTLNLAIHAQASEADRQSKLASYKRNNKGRRNSLVMSYYKMNEKTKVAGPAKIADFSGKKFQPKETSSKIMAENIVPKKGKFYNNI